MIKLNKGYSILFWIASRIQLVSGLKDKINMYAYLLTESDSKKEWKIGYEHFFYIHFFFHSTTDLYNKWYRLQNIWVDKASRSRTML